MIRKTILLVTLLAMFYFSFSQSTYSEQAPTNTSTNKTWWNLISYSLDVTPDYKNKYLSGINEMSFVTLSTGKTIEIDLQPPMRINSITWNKKNLTFTKSKEVYQVQFPAELKKGKTESIVIHFEGNPQEAKNAPFDSGWIWEKDEKGRPWMSVACQGSGASIWFPCKDGMYDEPDNGISFTINVPNEYTAVANGRLEKKEKKSNGNTAFTWRVKNPINSYNIIPYIGKYVNWKDEYHGEKGKLDLDFWVLDYNLKKSRDHFRQTDTMLRCFEYWMGPYPFYDDAYKLVEAPFPGMEHQSAVAYGNGFQNGYRGKDLFKNGWGMKWDFMIVHESGHEWFGNSITCNNYGDTWIHEGFTKYLETLYTDFVFGEKAGYEYALSTWQRIKNDQPVIGTGTTDKYYKGSAMLHMIRQITGDSVFRLWLRELNQRFYHQTVNSAQILESLNSFTKMDLAYMFDQYLRSVQVPVFEYKIIGDNLEYRWNECVANFKMPLKISIGGGQNEFVYPTTQWQKVSIANRSNKNVVVSNSFYCHTKQVNP